MWKHPVIQKTNHEALNFTEMTAEEMQLTRGSGSCFIIGTGDSSGDSGHCVIGGAADGSKKLNCFFVGSW